jgi:PAS domain S-box-containing protein
VTWPVTLLSRRVAELSFDNLVLPTTGPPRGDEIGRLEGKFDELLTLIRSARDELRAQSERLSATLGSMSDAVVAIDAQGRIQLMNPVAESLLGVEAADAAGKALASLMPLCSEHDGERAPDPIRRVLAAGRATEPPDRFVLATPSGERRTVHVTGAPMRDADGTVSGVVTVLRDVTEARRLEDELARIQKLETIQVLAAGIAHDFNNLLAGVLGYVSLSRALIDADSPAQERLQSAEDAIDRARGLTVQLLTFSRGGQPVRALHETSTLLRTAADLALRGISAGCVWDVASDLWPVFVDAGQIGQVVQNLVINAREAMPDGGTIHISARNVDTAPGPLPRGRYVQVSVRDEGAGIAPELAKRIFDPFFTTKVNGTGLGLAVCFSIIRKHGGHVDVVSEPGHGATFRFWLPAQREANPPKETTPPLHPPAHGTRGLGMGDDRALRDAAGQMLTALGYRPVCVADGEAALRAHAAEPFAVVLLDLTVPGGLGGRQTVARLRATDPKVRAIVCSGYNDDPIMADPEAFGFDGSLPKPFALRALEGELERVLSLARD